MTAADCKPRIAVLEDHDDTRELLFIFLENDFIVRPFREVPDLLNALQQEKFAAIVADIMLPGVDGYQFIQALRRDTRFTSLPVIAVTALAMESDREKMMASGFTDYLIKPVEPQEVANVLRRWIQISDREESPTS